MTEIDISGGGQGQLAEEEHESESVKGDHGTEGEENARPVVGVLDSAQGKVKGEVDVVTSSVVLDDDSHAKLDYSTLAQAGVRLTLNSSSEEPMIDVLEVKKIEQGPVVRPKLESLSESDTDKDEPWVKIEKEDLPNIEDKSEVDSKEDEKVVIEPETEAKPESETKAKDEAKPKDESEVKSPKPEPEMRFKPKLRGEAVVRPDSKVASMMNAGFLAELAAGIGGVRKEKQRPQGDEEGKAEADDADGSRDTKELSPIPQSPGTPKSPSLSLHSASSASDISLPPLEELPKLEHLGKSRPRRNKTRAVSRAVLKSDRSIEDIKEVDGGVDEFFERKEVNRDFVEVKTEDKEREKGDEEKKEDSKKKWSPFNNQPGPKGLAAGISSFFGRRDKPSPTLSPETSRRLTTQEEEGSRSPEPARRSVNKSPPPERRRTRERDSERPSSPVPAEEESKKKEEEEPTPPWRRSAAIPSLPTSTGGSTTGGASALLAEMRAKRASVKPVSPTSTKGENKENKENKEGNRSSIIPPPRENRNSIHPPPSIKDRDSLGKDRDSKIPASSAKDRDSIHPPSSLKDREPKDRDSIHPPSSTKDRSSVTPSSALRPSSGQPSSRPVPAPRSNSPATSAEKSEETSDSSPKTRLSFLSKPRPPPIAPKPRSKPSSGASATSSAKPTIITTPRTSALTGRISDPPPRVRSMFAGDSLKWDDASGSTGSGVVGNGHARQDKPADKDDSQDTPNGAAKKDGEFVLFL